ncbi:glycosyltransferase [Geodermatophilus sp. DF01-2]|uniref:glycosyltransferase family 4 protein n=1 Tax=Geodermatophilus sp. DF01-2 TaxID=2559610 RepID=UPI0010732F7E|nr:glycosyltransferase family 4 protein [Geodermatophilus sp. DF01_2]TFV55836.1 glycosyltransferase [Geodermatophilus sp. DF01_2]
MTVLGSAASHDDQVSFSVTVNQYANSMGMHIAGSVGVGEWPGRIEIRVNGARHNLRLGVTPAGERDSSTDRCFFTGAVAVPHDDETVRLELLVTGGDGRHICSRTVGVNLQRALSVESSQWMVQHTPVGEGRLIVVPHRDDVGGAQWWLREVRSAADTAGFVQDVIGTECVGGSTPWGPAGMWGCTSDEEYTGFVRAYRRRLEASRPAVVLVNTVEGLPAAHAALELGWPVVWAIHESYGPGRLWVSTHGAAAPPDRAVRALEECLRNAVVVFSCSAAASLYDTYLRPDRTFVIPFHRGREAGAAGALSRGELGLGVSDVVVLYVATIEQRKNQVPLLEAVRRARLMCPGLRLVLAGPGEPAYTSYLRRRIAEQLPDDVVLLDAPVVSDQLLPLADICVSTSDTESRSAWLTQALAFRKAILAMRATGFEELITDDVDGLLVECGNYVHFSDRLAELGSSQRLRQRLGEAAGVKDRSLSRRDWPKDVVALIRGTAASWGAASDV